MTIARKVVDFLQSSEGETTDQVPETEAASDPTGLYECESCAVTYINGEMEECPRCQTAVERVPSEGELGMLGPTE